MTGGHSRGTSANIDLTRRDREPDDCIQPNAVLLAADPATGRILQASANAIELNGIPAAEHIGRNIRDVLPEACAGAFESARRELPHSGPPLYVTPAQFGSLVRDLHAHHSGGVLILELERPGESPFASPCILYSRVREGLDALHNNTSVPGLLQESVRLFALCTGFERVTAYQLPEEGSPALIADSTAEGWEHHGRIDSAVSAIAAPAHGPVPLNRLRQIPDVNYEPVPIEPAINPASGSGLDLSFSVARSVSMTQRQHLQTMGVRAMMALTLGCNGRPWGLIAGMHHSAPRHLSYEVRAACEVIGRGIASIIEAREETEELQYRRHLDTLQIELVGRMGRGAGIADALLDPSVDALDSLQAHGLAVVCGGQVWSRGITPSHDQILRLVQEIAPSVGTHWATHRLSRESVSGGDFAAIGSGLLVSRIARRRPDFLLWFRPASVPGIGHAENPDEPPPVPEGGASRPWRHCQLEFAERLGREIIEVILDRPQHQAGLEQEVAKGRREIEVYLSLASHDLKEPLRGIHYSAQLLLRSGMERLTIDEVSRLNSIMNLTQRMDRLIENLLVYSRAGRPEGVRQTVNVGEICRDVLQSLAGAIETSGAQMRILYEMPHLRSDPAALRAIFEKLISNALQFNTQAAKRVEIGYIPGEIPTFFVRDNGIGIAPEDREDVFRLFKRLHRKDEFGGGTGAGLSIARRTVEALGGRMWIESNPGEGSTLYFTLGDERA